MTERSDQATKNEWVILSTKRPLATVNFEGTFWSQ